MKEIERYLNKHGFGHFAPKAVLFDMDGVIYNSMPNHAVAWHRSMAHYGIEMTPEEAYLYEGMRGVETIQMKCREQWHRDISEEEAHRMYELKSTIYQQCPKAGKIPDIENLMQQIKTDGCDICVVTGSGQKTLLEKLDKDLHGLIVRDKIVSSFDVTHGKPDPMPYLVGMQKTHTEPWQTVVVENAPLGVRAAVAARCFTIAVNTGPLPDQTLADEGADLVLPDMKHVMAIWPELLKGTDR